MDALNGASDERGTYLESEAMSYAAFLDLGIKDLRVHMLHPSVCDAPHRETDPDRTIMLMESLDRSGWRHDRPVLLGYRLDNRVQLISGTHRHIAAWRLDKLLPVILIPKDTIDALYGTDAWVTMMQNPPLYGECEQLC